MIDTTRLQFEDTDVQSARKLQSAFPNATHVYRDREGKLYVHTGHNRMPTFLPDDFLKLEFPSLPCGRAVTLSQILEGATLD